MSADKDRADWLKRRRQGLGGSDVPAILGLSSFSSPWSIWANKVGLLSDSESTQRQRIGQRMELVLAEEFHDATGLYVVGEQMELTHPEHSWRRCTLDGLVAESPNSSIDEAVGLTEFKTDGRFGWPEGPPANVRCQTLWGLHVSGLLRAWIVVMFAGFRVEIHTVDMDEEALADVAFMVERAAEFWQLVVTGEPPEVDGSEATFDALAAVYPHEQPGKTAELDHVAICNYNEWRQRTEEALAAKKSVDDARAHLIAALGDAEIGLFGDTPLVSLRSQTRTTTCGHCGQKDESAPYRVLRPVKQKKTKETA